MYVMKMQFETLYNYENAQYKPKRNDSTLPYIPFFREFCVYKAIQKAIFFSLPIKQIKK